MEKYKVTYYSIDHIKMGLIRGLENCQFSTTDSDVYITDKIWPIIKGIIMTAIENHQNIIIEGVYIPPQNIGEFEEQYSKYITPVFLCFSEAYIRENFNSKILKYRNVIEQRVYDEDRDASYFIDSHRKLAEDCESYNIDYYKVEMSFENTVNEIFNFLDLVMGKNAEENIV
jgi:putative acetyltransferase